MTEPQTPREAYQAIIDGLVADTTHSGSARCIEERGEYFPDPDGEEAAINAFVRSLTPEQKGYVAAMLEYERWGTIHDVLAKLTWWIETRGVGLTFRQQPMPVDLSGMGLHGDFVGRLQGDWEWPAT